MTDDKINIAELAHIGRTGKICEDACRIQNAESGCYCAMVADALLAQAAEIARLTADLAESRAYALAQFFAGRDAKMSKKPERIWARPDYNECWHKQLEEEDVEYVRADLYAAKSAEIARLTADLAESRAYALALEQELRDRAEKAEAERDAALVGAVKVKPLVWEKLGERAWRAPSPFFGSFRVECYGGGPWQALWSVPGFCDTFVDGDFAGPDDAKQAIDARILAAIQPDPDARQEALAGAFSMGRDAAAAIPADHAEYARKSLGATTHPQYASDWSIIVSRCDMIVDAIRALTPPADLAAKIGGE